MVKTAGKPQKRGDGEYSLVVVESPAKAKTIKKYLGKGYQVVASNGHIKDLPKSKLGVDVKKKFAMDIVAITGKKVIIDKIDSVLAQHYGFTDKELDFIVNYDIKYRSGADEDEDE